MLRDFGMLVARATIGLAFASHGSQKAFGWFGGPGPVGAAGFLESLGFKPGAPYAALTSYTEMAAGTLLCIGLGGPLAPGAILGVMLVAQATVHAKNGFYAQKAGVDLGVIYGAAAIAIAMAGYGRLSLDTALGFEDLLDDERLSWVILTGGLLGGLIALGQREELPSSESAL